MNITAFWQAQRWYQKAAIADVAAAFKAGARTVLLVLETGAGKTVLFSFIAARQKDRGKRSLVLVHRRELIAQTVATFEKFGVECGVIARGYALNPNATIQVASSHLVARRIKDNTLALAGWTPDLIILDECHHGVSPSLRSIIDYWTGAKLLGVTATPARLDHKGLGAIFEVMVQGPPTRKLIDEGWLADYRAFSHPIEGFDRGKLRKIAGDFRRADMEEQLDTPVCLGDAIEHYERHLFGRRALVFCVGVDHAEHVAKAFQLAGHPAANVDGSMPVERRDDILKGFVRGDILVLSSCEILGEGLDVGECGGVILLRPTASLTLHKQQVGRALRPKSDGSKAIILDHVGNVLSLGLPDDEHEWSLDGAKPKPTKQIACPWCAMLNRSGRIHCINEACQGYLLGPGPRGWQECKHCAARASINRTDAGCYYHLHLDACPSCDHRPLADTAGAKSRSLMLKDGQLAEINRQDKAWMMIGDIRFAIRRCKSLAELVELGERRAAAGQITFSYGPMPWARRKWREKLAEVEADPRRREILLTTSHEETIVALQSLEDAAWWANAMGYSKGWVRRIIHERGW